MAQIHKVDDLVIGGAMKQNTVIILMILPITINLKILFCPVRDMIQIHLSKLNKAIQSRCKLMLKTCECRSRYARSHLDVKFEDHQFVVNAAVRHECQTVAAMAPVISSVKEMKQCGGPS